MVDYTLCGNCEPCPACALRHELQDKSRILREPIGCNICKGTGLVALSDEEIVRRTVAEARLHYWPKVNARLQSLQPGVKLKS